MRILHCSPTLLAGGAERQLAYLAVEQVRIGHDVHVAVMAEGQLAERVRAAGATIHHLRGSGNRDPRLLWQIYRLIGRLQPEIVHTWLMQMDVIGGAAALARRKAWVLSEQASAAAYDVPFAGVRAFLARGAGAVDANSAFGADYWAAVRPRLPRYVIPSAVPVEEIAASPAADPAALQLPPGVPIVLYAGRFVEQKNVLRIPLVLQQLFADRDAVAVLFGDGPLLEPTRDAARSAGIESRVRFPGFGTDLWSWMKIATAFLSPTFFEGRPNTVMEAAACRCPLVVSDIPEHREFLDEQSALLVPPDDVAAIAAALRRIIDFPAEAAARAERAYQAIAAVTVAAMTARVDQLYDDVLRARGNHRS
jgi:glycosyltransferase involved in cell wall biosynthesis